ncbi:MAG: valine--tRNA ligase [Nitrospirae bacterium]|nr:valine--tRNA ligase [Candidatus Troglogloeales bacterium]
MSNADQNQSVPVGNQSSKSDRLSPQGGKIYDPSVVEEKWVKIWEASGVFRADPQSTDPTFSMVIPPPNVTGVLHLGHALNTTLQDILARYKRMKGFNVLWLPGTDHAGIATQNVIERQLAQEEISRHDIGREAFIQKIWEWKEQSGGTIISQLKKLGASCDWSRERFTLDDELSKAVTNIFVRLYNEGLIYRAKRLVNGCPACQTALSDIEVEHEETQGSLYHIQYPLADDPTKFLTVATTRPETMLADTAVAVHPEDPRFNALIGKFVQLPLTTRTIPIVGDSILVDREFGTGAVKITPGHDFNDEKAGKRHKLPIISLSDAELKGRERVVSALQEKGLLIAVKDHLMSVGKCYRCKSIIEPTCSSQWFVKVNDPQNSLARPAIDAVRERKVRLIPETWEPNYFGWMENIEDWCISRQIWWGHPIPAWYCVGNDIGQCGPGCAEPIVSAIPPLKCPKCGSANLRQDADVLDTWFSSALWPFSTLGWPDGDSPLFKKFYPTNTLISGFDILFFWVARMIMMGLHFTKEVPFRDVYIHALVRDAKGQKMSKSKGNVIDPIALMNQYGTDALRFTLASMASPGRDIKLAEDRIIGYRNFANKIWNAARFIQICVEEKTDTTTSSLSSPDIWIKMRLYETTVAVDKALERYRIDEAAEIVYQFVWHQFCDWYLELSKVTKTTDTLTSVFHDILCLLHPFMPFITQELLASDGKNFFPKVDGTFLNNPENVAMARLVDTMIIEMVTKIRNVRGEMNIPPSEEMDIVIDMKLCAGGNSASTVTPFLPYIKRLARIRDITIMIDKSPPKRSAIIPTAWGVVYLLLDMPHIQKEIDRLLKVAQKLDKEMTSVTNRLNNPDFIKAPVEVRAKTNIAYHELKQKKQDGIAQISRMQGLLV